MTRSCTDIPCCLLFVCFLISFCAAVAYGQLNGGDPVKLTIGWDHDGRGCGFTKEVKDYPFLYWPEAPSKALIDEIKNGTMSGITLLLRTGVCVKECPMADTQTIECLPTVQMENRDRYKVEGRTVCNYMLS